MRGEEGLNYRRGAKIPGQKLTRIVAHLPMELAKILDLHAMAKGLSLSAYLRSILAERIDRRDLG